MTITTRDQLIASINSIPPLMIEKASTGNVGASTYTSYWRMTGTPPQGAIPAAVTVCNNTTAGALGGTQAGAGEEVRVARAEWALGGAHSFELHDRLVHRGGLNGTLTTAQTVGIDLLTLAGTNNISERIGASDYTNVLWMLEWYTATGATAVNATVNVTYEDGSTGNLSAIALAATRPGSFTVVLNSYIPSGVTNKGIRAVNSVTLSATTGTAGNFGVTAYRKLFGSQTPIVGVNYVMDWAQLGLPKVPNESCLVPMLFSTGTVAAYIKGLITLARG